MNRKLTVLLLLASLLLPTLPDSFATQATGGTITYSGGYTIHTFTTSGTFTVTSGGSVEYLVIGGGGGGGNAAANSNGGGGGGAGGMQSGTLTATIQAYTITVGAGGAANATGSSSIFDTVTSTGGVGGSNGNTVDGGRGGNSPNGGGNGGTGGANKDGGGGGGDSAAGANGGNTNGGNGGAGTASSISGASVTYAGGGGGGCYNGGAACTTAGTGGAGGGGAGLKGPGTATVGTANRGGGGGGAGADAGTGGTGGAGGSGIVIIKYLTVQSPDAVDDLTYTTLDNTSVDLDWTAPSAGGGNQAIIGYQINRTTPWTSDPLVYVNDTGTTDTDYLVTGLTFGTDYSFRVSAWTNNTNGHPINNAAGNVLNVTTTATSYSTPPVLTAFGPSSATTQIDLEFPSSTMQNINGYRIQRETPIGTGWTTIVSNTTTATQYYNNTGLTSNIIYNYRVYAMNSTGLSTASNTYPMTTFHLPDAVDDLAGVATDLSTINLSWSAPTSYAPAITGYMINATTPTGEPVDILNTNTGSTATTATALNLLIGQEYSFRVSAITVHGKNASGNIWNGTTVETFVIGNLTNPDVENTNDFSIFFDRTDLNSTAIQLDVTYPNSYDLSCDFKYKYARTNQTYSGLTTVPDGTDDQTATFTLINATGDLVQVRCWDPVSGDESTYVITITDFPFLQQVNALRNGEYGTFFQIGAFDGVMLIVIFLGMIGLNRTTPIVGIIFVVITTFAMSYFGLITYPVIMYPALIMMIVWAFVTTRKDD